MQRFQPSKRRLPCSQFPRGTAVVEMAVVFPLFILLVFGLVEFVRMGMVKQALSDAARAGCRSDDPQVSAVHDVQFPGRRKMPRLHHASKSDRNDVRCRNHSQGRSELL